MTVREAASGKGQRSFPNIVVLFTRGKHLRQLPIFPRVDVPANLPRRSDCAMLSEMSSISGSTGLGLQVKGHDGTNK